MGILTNIMAQRHRPTHREFESQIPPTNAVDNAGELQEQIARLQFENNELREEVTKYKSKFMDALSYIQKLEETEFFANILAESMVSLIVMCIPFLKSYDFSDYLLSYAKGNLVQLGRSPKEAELYVANVIEEQETKRQKNMENFRNNPH
jgi:hypothetical protein